MLCRGIGAGGLGPIPNPAHRNSDVRDGSTMMKESTSPLSGTAILRHQARALARGAPIVAVGLSAIGWLRVGIGAMDRATRRGLALIALGLVAALATAWLLGRGFFQRPMAALLTAASYWRAGNYGSRSGLTAKGR